MIECQRCSEVNRALISKYRLGSRTTEAIICLVASHSVIMLLFWYSVALSHPPNQPSTRFANQRFFPMVWLVSNQSGAIPMSDNLSAKQVLKIGKRLDLDWIEYPSDIIPLLPMVWGSRWGRKPIGKSFGFMTLENTARLLRCGFGIIFSD